VVDTGRLVVGSWVVDGRWSVGRGQKGIVHTMGTGMVVTIGMGIVVTMGMGIVVTMGMGMVSMSRCMDRDVAGGMVGDSIFLLILVLVNLIGGSRGLAGHNCVGISTGFMD